MFFFLTSFHVQDTSRKLSLLSNIFKKSSKYCRRVFICTMYYFASISIFFSLYAHVLSNTTTKALIAHIKIDLLKKQKKQQQNIAVCPRRKEGFSVVTKIKSWTQQAKPQINPPSTTSSIPPFTSWVQKVWKAGHLHKVSHRSLSLLLLDNLRLVHVLINQVKRYSTLHELVEGKASCGKKKTKTF